jgi:parvulin-like peptidyl-prolyl isomerase
VSKFWRSLAMALSLLALHGWGHTGTLIDRIVAVVNDDVVTLSEVEAAAKSFLEMREEGGLDKKSIREIREKLLDRLRLQVN